MAASYSEILEIALSEMTGHLASSRSPAFRKAAELALRAPAVSLAKQLVGFDADLERLRDLRRASLLLLDRYGVRARVVDTSGGPHDLAARAAALPETGPLVIVSNHPGLYDALALFSAIRRKDLQVIAAERDLLSALPNLAPYLLTAKGDARAGFALRTALRHLKAGGALLHFAAGRIEPDPRLAPQNEEFLLPWKPGLKTLIQMAVRANVPLCVVPALVSGVVSKRALGVARTLGRGSALTDAFVPLLQLTLPFFGDVDVRVAFGGALGAETLLGDHGDPERSLRAALLALASARPLSFARGSHYVSDYDDGKREIPD